MLVELQPDKRGSVRSLVSCARVPAQAVLLGHAPGRVFVNREHQPTAVFVWGEFRYCYLAGDSSDHTFVTDLAHLLADELIPAVRGSHDPTIVFYPDAPGWLDQIGQLAPDGDPRFMAPRQLFTFNPAHFRLHDRASRVPDGLRLQRITGELAQAIVTPLVGILWHSVEDFLAHGLGFCVLEGDRIASTCFSAFADGQHVEISIDTHPDYRQRGLATLCGAAFIAHCLTHNLKPIWECWNDNLPSIQLASRLGFQKGAEQITCFVDLSRPAVNE